MFNNFTLTPFGHRKWSEFDRLKLIWAYEQGLSLKKISELTGRSFESVNKAVSRFGLRHESAQRQRVKGNSVESALLFEKTKARIKQHEQHYIVLSHHQPIQQKRQKSYPLALDLPKAFNRPVVSLNQECLVKFKDIIDYAHQLKWHLNVCHHHHYKAQGCTHVLNNQPMTPAGLLVAVNKHRREQGLPIFHVLDITQP